MEKVIILTYYWPPSGGPGVQRWLKFVKYMPLYGLEPIVVTVDPDHATYPVTDTELEHEVNPGLQIFRTPTREPYTLYKKIFRKKQVPYSGFTNDDAVSFSSSLSRFIRGNLFVPDARKGWNSFAIKKAAELIEQLGINLLITTSPPHSTQLAGLKLKRMFPHLRWVADLRDPWTDIFYYKKMHHLPFTRRFDLALEKSVLKKADVVVTVSEHLRSLFERKQDQEPHTPPVVIPNGFDPDDFEGMEDRPDAEYFTIGYAGTLSDAYNLSGFLMALQDILVADGRKLRMNIAGNLSSRWSGQLEKILPDRLVNQGHVNHQQAIRTMLQSDLLLLVIPEIEHNEGIITGKIFEYLAAGRPVLGVGPVHGDAAWILERTKSGRMFDYADQGGIKNFLVSYTKGKESFNPEIREVNSFSRKELTGKLASVVTTKL